VRVEDGTITLDSVVPAFFLQSPNPGWQPTSQYDGALPLLTVRLQLGSEGEISKLPVRILRATISKSTSSTRQAKVRTASRRFADALPKGERHQCEGKDSRAHDCSYSES
jgi:hypothetical protein